MQGKSETKIYVNKTLLNIVKKKKNYFPLIKLPNNVEGGVFAFYCIKNYLSFS